jgi:hypothetical protein
MRIAAVFAGLASLLLAVTPVAASENDHNSGPPVWTRLDEQRPDGNHDGPGQSWDGDHRPDNWGPDGRNDGDGPNRPSGGWGPWSQFGDQGPDWGHHRRGIFRDPNDGLSDDQADALSDAFQDCVSSDQLKDLRRSQLRELIGTIGLTDRERKHIHSRDDLSDALSHQLDSDNVQDLKVNQILQVAHACGLSTHDVLTIIHEA